MQEAQPEHHHSDLSSTKVRHFFRTLHQEINQGVRYQDLLDNVFDMLYPLIPFDRIGIALIENKYIRLDWVRSNLPVKSLSRNYAAKLKNSSLEKIIESGEPRIINDLRTYLTQHPSSKSTALALEDGIRSSLTCPLIINGKPIGVIFFSSGTPFTYNKDHIDLFSEISEGISILVEQEVFKKKAIKDHQKEEELRTAIHDLRNSVTVIQGSLSLIQKSQWLNTLSDHDKRILLFFKKNADQMIHLINKIAYNRQQKDSQDHLIGLNDFFDEVSYDAHIMCERKSMKLQMKRMNIHSLVKMESEAVKNALYNLLSNAIKFSPRGSTVSIYLSYHQEDSALHVEVADEGPGIPLDEQEKLFTPLGQTSVKPTEGESSSGRGLMSVKNYVESQGGRVFFQSTPGQGSIFGFSIPVHLC